MLYWYKKWRMDTNTDAPAKLLIATSLPLPLAGDWGLKLCLNISDPVCDNDSRYAAAT